MGRGEEGIKSFSKIGLDVFLQKFKRESHAQRGCGSGVRPSALAALEKHQVGLDTDADQFYIVLFIPTNFYFCFCLVKLLILSPQLTNTFFIKSLVIIVDSVDTCITGVFPTFFFRPIALINSTCHDRRGRNYLGVG